MLNRLRDVRKSLGLTLEDVAKRCDPPTTAQTIGRLETGTRNLSLAWMNRIADALQVESSALLAADDSNDIPVAARLGATGALALTKPQTAQPPRGGAKTVEMRVDATLGEYRAGDRLWLKQLEPAEWGQALNRDTLVPRPNGRFVFGRLIGLDGERLQILPPGSGQRQQVITAPVWIAVAEMVIRPL